MLLEYQLVYPNKLEPTKLDGNGTIALDLPITSGHIANTTSSGNLISVHAQLYVNLCIQYYSFLENNCKCIFILQNDLFYNTRKTIREALAPRQLDYV